MSEPDVAELLSKHDSANMADLTRSFVDDFESAIKNQTGLSSDTDWSGVVCLGMGGSGAGGRFLKSLADFEGGMPFVFWSDYGLPSWWGPEWLVLATSYSGNTEETLDGVREALESGGSVIAVSSGGQLSDLVLSSDDATLIQVPGEMMPRSAFGHIFGSQMAACWDMGLLRRPSEDDMTAMLDRLRKISAETDPVGGDMMWQTMARSLVDREIGIISPTEMGAAGYRFACQINENANGFANPTDVPEMNHNEIVAWHSEGQSRAMIALTCEGIHPRSQARMNWLLDKIESRVSWRIECEGEDLLERLLYAAHVTDWVSIMLAVLKGNDPSEMAPIESLKAHLSTV
tara:strand:+ start:11124 stop:12161 length:1038 start_codon:yes stop_codon:yes gene_type:complete